MYKLLLAFELHLFFISINIMKVVDLTSFEHLNQLSEQYKNIIVSISASWCKPCKVIKPKIEKFLEVIDKENFVYVKIDYDSVYSQDPQLEAIFNISRIPYFCFIRDRKSEYGVISGDFNEVSKNLFSLITKYDQMDNSFDKNQDF